MRAGGVERDVTFDRAEDTPTAAVDDAYRAKYGRYSGSLWGSRIRLRC